MLCKGSFRVVLLGAAVLALVAGCGGDDDDKGGAEQASQFAPGVAGAKRIDGLTGDEAEQLCKAYDDYMSARFTPDLMKKFACTMTAGLSVQTDAECGAKVDECLRRADAGGPMDAEPGPDLSCQAGGEAPEGGAVPAACAATVDEFAACVTAVVDQRTTLIGEMTCESIRAAVQNGDGGAVPTTAPLMPEACDVIKEKCPSFFVEVSSGS